MFDSAPIASRVADLEAAFADESVDAILTTIGGFNCNELLPYLNFDIIARNPRFSVVIRTQLPCSMPSMPKQVYRLTWDHSIAALRCVRDKITRLRPGSRL